MDTISCALDVGSIPQEPDCLAVCKWQLSVQAGWCTALHQVTCSVSAALRVHEWAVSRVNMSQVLDGPSPDASLLYGLIQPNGGWGLYQLRIINRIYFYLPSFIRCEAQNVSLPKDGIWELHAK